MGSSPTRASSAHTCTGYGNLHGQEARVALSVGMESGGLEASPGDLDLEATH